MIGKPKVNRVLSVVFVIAALSVILFAVGGAGASDTDVASQPNDLESIHDNMEGSGTSNQPYEVSNVLQLQAVTEDLDSHYVLVDDIDARPTAMWDGGKGFEPIGDGDFTTFPMSEDEEESLGFQGHFDGNGHEIRGLQIDRSHSDTGLFGEVGPGGAVENLTVRQAEVDSAARIGVVAGLVVQGEIRNVSVVDSQLNQWHYQGGVVGVAYNNTKIEQVTFSGETSAEGLGIGGIVGWMSNESHVHQCAVDVEMSGDAGPSLSQDAGTGGVVGIMSNSTVSECGAEVDIDAPSQYRVGGLVGTVPNPDTDPGWWDRNELVPGHIGGGTIENSYVQGQIVGEDEVGGMIGFLSRVSSADDEEIDTGYVAADVAATDPRDGWFGSELVGIIFGGISTLGDHNQTNMYYDEDYEGSQPDHQNVDPLRGHEMKGDPAVDNMDGFDFETVWNPTGSPWPTYPHLAWEDRSEDSPTTLSWRFFDLAKVVGEFLAVIAGISGLIGLLLSHGQPAIKRRSTGLIVGSVAGLLTISFINGVFEMISWIMTGDTTAQAGAAMIPPILHGREIFHQALPITSVLSQISAVIGAGGIAIGAGLLAISSKQSSLWNTSRQSIGVGIVLMIVSVGGRLFSVAAVVVLG